MIYNFIARDVVILNFGPLADLQGITIPTEAYCEITNPIPILYAGNYEKVLGNCYLYRIGDQLCADMYLTSKYNDEKTLLKYMRLTPSLAFRPKEGIGNTILVLEPWYLSLSLSKNSDPTIGPLKKKVNYIAVGEYVN